MIYTAHYRSPVGGLLLAARGDALIGLWIEGQKIALDSASEPLSEEKTAVLAQACVWLDRYFAGLQPRIAELRLAPAGSDFRQAVWRRLCEIPYGETVSYGTIAKQLAAQSGRERLSAQAVGGAVGHNPISIMIPCHRVVGANGSLTGYAGGIPIKIKLLTHEGADMTRLFVPK